MTHKSLPDILLPTRRDGNAPQALPSCRQITLIGTNGAGKTRFMNALMESCGDRAYCLSALSASFPERHVSKKSGSIDMLYSHAVGKQPFLKDTAVSEIDKLAFLLFTDELEYLLSIKARSLEGEHVTLRPTKLDKLASMWKKIFPGSSIVKHEGHLMFANRSGEGFISQVKLSRGEQTVLYYIAAVMYAMPNAVIFIENPTLFLHPAIMTTFWNAIEDLRPDCTFIYDSVDVSFVNSRTENTCIWVKSYDSGAHAWDYEILSSERLPDELLVDLMGSRKPVLFIEGDATHSIDAKLYTLVFSDFTVRPLGSCEKVIEVTRTFNDMKPMHQLDSRGIVDRDRRTPEEVAYLRRKNIMVLNVAEVENIFLLEGVIRIIAARRNRNGDKIFENVKRKVMAEFASQYEAQALMHVRHRVKREVECKIDARFTCITALETHLRSLINMLHPREHYNRLLAEFKQMIDADDYDGVLRIFNNKPTLSNSGVAQMLGYNSVEGYIGGVLTALKGSSADSIALKETIKKCFDITHADALPQHRDVNSSPQERKHQAPSHKLTKSERRQERNELRRQKKRYRQEKHGN